MPLKSDEDSIEQLWVQAKEAASVGNLRGTLFMLKSLVDLGEWTACARIGELYETGAVGIDRDITQAVKWYRKAIFEIDDSVAHLGMGRALFNGDGLDKNETLAVAHFKKAFALGEAESGVYLGIICLSNRDIEQAKQYFMRAADADYCFAHVGLARVAFRQLEFLDGLRQIINTIAKTIKIYREDPLDRRLIGIVTKVKYHSNKNGKNEQKRGPTPL